MIPKRDDLLKAADARAEAARKVENISKAFAAWVNDSSPALDSVFRHKFEIELTDTDTSAIRDAFKEAGYEKVSFPSIVGEPHLEVTVTI